jgi:hypothetical protein
VVDCDDLLGKTFLLDGVLWEVVEVDESTKLAKYARAVSDIDAEMGDASRAANMQVEDEELEEATSAKTTALLAMETPGVSVEEVHTLLGLAEQCDDMIEYSPDPDIYAAHSKYVGSKGGTGEGAGSEVYVCGPVAPFRLLQRATAPTFWYVGLCLVLLLHFRHRVPLACDWRV